MTYCQHRCDVFFLLQVVEITFEIFYILFFSCPLQLESSKETSATLVKYRGREQSALAELAKSRAVIEQYKQQYDPELCELRRWKEECAGHPSSYFVKLEHRYEMQQLERRFQAEISALKAQVAEAYMGDGEKWADFFKRKYYSLLVLDDETGLPQVCPHTGEALPKAAKFERERDEALAEVRDLRMRLPADATLALLERVQRKARHFKRKYRFLKTFMRENLYVGDMDDTFCETTDKVHSDPESDEEIRGGEPSKYYYSSTTPSSPSHHHDLAVPFGFVAREPADDE